MPRISIPLPVTYSSDSRSAAPSYIENFAAIQRANGTVELEKTPKLIGRTAPATIYARMLAVTSNYAVMVAHNTAYKDNGTTTTAIGVVDAGGVTGKMVSVDTGTHLVIVDPALNTCCGIALPALAAVTTITPPGGITFSAVAYQDGYTIYAREDSDEFYISALDDPTTIGALDFSTADALPGNIVGIISDHRELVIFKERSIEFWVNTGNASFPFERSQPGVAEVGCITSKSIAKHENTIYFQGSDGAVYRLRGYQPERVSNDSVSAALFSATGGAPGAGIFWFSGRAYYGISGGSGMWCMDLETLSWHLRTSPDVSWYAVASGMIGSYVRSFAMVRSGSYTWLCNYTYGGGAYDDTDAGSAMVRTVRVTLPDTPHGMLLREVATEAAVASGTVMANIAGAIYAAATRAARYHAWRRCGRRKNDALTLFFPADTSSVSSIVIDFEPLE